MARLLWRWLADLVVPDDAFAVTPPWIPHNPTVLRLFLDHGVLP